VTWRGDDQFKEMKAKLRPIPDSHDRTSRAAALAYTRETDVLSVGVLYEVQKPSLVDRIQGIRELARRAGPEPSTADIVRSFYPKF